MPQIIHPPDEPQLVARALRAYGRNDVDHRTVTVQEHAGRVYVVLDSSPPRPVIYRLRSDGAIYRLATPPAELTNGETL
jgi:hypothetical protein